MVLMPTFFLMQIIILILPIIFILGNLKQMDSHKYYLELQIEINLLYKFMNFQSLQFELKGAGRW